MTEMMCGYYGKLPISPEFLRLHASGPELRWLDEWLQHGVLSAKVQEGAAWPARLAAASPYGFFYLPPHEGRVVCGAIVASQDKAGRSFPFLSYGLIDRSDVASKPWLIPVATARLLNDITGAVRALHEGLDWEAFCRMVEDLSIRPPDLSGAMEIFARFTQSTTVGQWCVGESTPSGEAKQLAMEQLFTRVMQARRRGEHSLRVPIGPDRNSGNLDLSFWLQLCLQQRPDVLTARAGLLCFWTRARQNDSGGRAVLSIGPGSPDVVRFLVNPEAQDGTWWDMATPIPDSVLAQTEGGPERQSIDAQDSLMKVAEQLCDQTGHIAPSPDRVRPESVRRGPSILAVL
jgi:type VI secretion system ImpM family protein